MNEIHFHRRNLPHIYRPNSTYFITFRLKGSIPRILLEKLKEKYSIKQNPKTRMEKYYNDIKFFYDYDKLLDNNDKIQYLKNTKIAAIVKSSLHHFDGIEYKLICYSIMSNHVHLVFHLLEGARSLDKIMMSVKGYSACQSNKILKRKGNFWQSESYDHIIRDEDDLKRIIEYVLLNPVKAGVVDDWREYDNNYLAEEWG